MNDVTLSFGGIAALSNIGLMVVEREIRAIIGPNGAGKSSLINLISGIYRPDSGQHRHRQPPLRPAVPTQRLAALGVARTFQNLALFPGLERPRQRRPIGLTHQSGQRSSRRSWACRRPRVPSAAERAACRRDPGLPPADRVSRAGPSARWPTACRSASSSRGRLVAEPHLLAPRRADGRHERATRSTR